MKEGQKRLLKLLHQIWTEPGRFDATPAQSKVMDQLENFLKRKRRRGGLVICGEHGVGKTFTIRKFLADKNLLNKEFYANVSLHVIYNLGKRGLSTNRVDSISDIVLDLIAKFSDLLVLDSCEILQLLPSRLFNPIFTKIKYYPSSKGKIIIVYPTHPSKLLIGMDSIYIPYPTREDIKVFVENLRRVFDESYVEEKTFTDLTMRMFKNV